MWLTALASLKNTVALTKVAGRHARQLSGSSALCLNQKWRKERGLPLNPNSTGILTDGPDYTFLDGRATPYGSRQTQRIKKHEELTEQIITLSAEMDFAVERHKRIQEDEASRRKKIIDGKLKPKGLALLKQKSKQD